MMPGGHPGRRRARGRWLLLLALMGGAVAAPAAAQERGERRDCRCVDAEGREIERCVCFRTPDVEVRALREALVAAGRRARIGVSLEESAEGARVTEVAEDGPAEQAGIREGDVITHVDGRSLREALPDPDDERRLDEDQVTVGRLMALARAWEPGEEVTLELLREGERMTVEVEPEAWTASAFYFGDGGLRALGRGGDALLWSFPRGEGSFRLWSDSARAFRFDVDSLARRFRFGPDASTVVLSPSLDPCFRSGGAWGLFGGDCVDGARLVDLNPELGEYFGTSEGVLVAEVAEGSELGLRAGDVILSIGGRTVGDPEDARRILRSYDADEEVVFRIVRKQEEMEVRGTRR